MEPSKLELGASAEELAARYLSERGYAIVERNWKTRAGELDLVARTGPAGAMLVFVEVRSRADAEHGAAEEMVGYRKQRRVTTMAAHYLVARDPAYEEIRFDVVAVTGGVVEHFVDAFRPGLR